MKNTFDLVKFLRSSLNNPLKDLSSKNELQTPVTILKNEIQQITKISKLAVFMKTAKGGFLISYALNQEDMDKEFEKITMHRKYNNILYDVELKKESYYLMLIS